MCLAVDKFRAEFGIDDFLAVVQSVVARKHVPQGNRQQEIGHASKPKQFKADEQGGNGAVCDAAEYSAHAGCGAQGGAKSNQVSKQASKGGADKEGRYNLPTLKTGA